MTIFLALYFCVIKNVVYSIPFSVAVCYTINDVTKN